MLRRLLATFTLLALVCASGSARADVPCQPLDGALAQAMLFSNGDPRAVYTVVDVAFLKTIATALEKYSVDHQGAYPTSLDNLTPTYLKMVPIAPASPTGTHYGYRAPAPDKRMGHYLITDGDAQVDAQYSSGAPIPDGVGGSPCKPGACLHLSYAQALGVIGRP